MSRLEGFHKALDLPVLDNIIFSFSKMSASFSKGTTAVDLQKRILHTIQIAIPYLEYEDKFL